MEAREGGEEGGEGGGGEGRAGYGGGGGGLDGNEDGTNEEGGEDLDEGVEEAEDAREEDSVPHGVEGLEEEFGGGLGASGVGGGRRAKRVASEAGGERSGWRAKRAIGCVGELVMRGVRYVM